MADSRLRGSVTAGLLVLAALACCCAWPVDSRAVNPRPQTIPALRQWNGGEGALRLRRTPRIVLAGRSRGRLRSTAKVFAADLRGLTGRPVRVVRRRRVRRRRGDIRLLLGARDARLGSEGYRLKIGRTVVIRARTRAGVFYGTRTLLQLLRQGRAIPRGRALDWPRYPERGLMIDLGRRIYSPSWIKAHIRELAYLKLNLLHLHLSDDQRWGVQSGRHPEIVSPNALTKRQLREVVALARRYQVTVVPEIDMPGHLGSVFKAHPELELKTVLGQVPPPSPDTRKLDITNPAALSLVRELIEEYLPLFPGRYWHVGADEYMMPAQYALYPQLAAYARRAYGPGASTKDAILGFVNWVDRIVRVHGKTLRAWHDELGDGRAVRANPDIVVEWWVNVSPLSDLQPPTPAELLAEGHRIMNVGWYPTYYTGNFGPFVGKSDIGRAYESWQVNQFYGPYASDPSLQAPPYVIAASEPRNLGSKVNAWNNAELSERQIADGIYPRLRVIAQKTWDSAVLSPAYSDFERVMRALGHAPGY